MKFEHISILKGKLSEEEKNKQIEKFKKYFADNNIAMCEFEDLGLKKLAYDIKNNKEGFYIKFIVDINNMNVETFENWIRKNDNVLKFITIKMEHSLEQKTNIYNEIKRLGESNLFNAIAEEVIYQLDNNSTDNLELTVENVKDIVNDILDDDYFNDNLNNCVKYAIENKVKEQEEVEEQEEV